MHPPFFPDSMVILRSQRGLLAQVADGLQVSRAVVARWERVPAERLPEVEAACGIKRWILRPDICPPPPFGSAEWIAGVRQLLSVWDGPKQKRAEVFAQAQPCGCEAA